MDEGSRLAEWMPGRRYKRVERSKRALTTGV